MLASALQPAKKLIPPTDELPSNYADRLGQMYAEGMSEESKKERGQFFTPTSIARFMGRLAEVENSEIRILDPGCGTGVLSCAVAEWLAASGRVKQIVLTGYETDSDLVPLSEEALSYLKSWLWDRDIELAYTLVPTDFVLDNQDALKPHGLFESERPDYDLVITNPPYFKLSGDDPRALAGAHVVNGHANIYSIFLAIAASQLRDDGQMIFITPRSFSSGSYFSAFREYFFGHMQVTRVHLFHSRKEAFGRDSVLQETVILNCRKREESSNDRLLLVSSSKGASDLDVPEVLTTTASTILNRSSKEKVLYLPTSHEELRIVELFQGWKHTLSDFGIQISTGPVVAFRARQFIRESVSEDSCPLFWLHNVKPMTLEWPIMKEGKGQHIRVNRESASLLLPNRSYVLLRRFSSKDDRRRLIAAPYFGQTAHVDFIGVENKVNYIYRPHGHLCRSEVVGLCALLNSNLFDRFFRIFNGNVNVSATELRMMPMPPLASIEKIGEAIMRSNDFSPQFADDLVQRDLGVPNE